MVWLLSCPQKSQLHWYFSFKLKNSVEKSWLEKPFPLSVRILMVSAWKLCPPHTTQRVSLFLFSWNVWVYFPLLPLDSQLCRLEEFKQDPDFSSGTSALNKKMHLRWPWNNLKLISPTRATAEGKHCSCGRTYQAVARALESRIRMASFIFLCKLPDRLRRDGSKEQNKTLTCMTE